MCEEPIARQRGQAGSRRVDSEGLPAKTIFNSLARFSDGTELCEALPKTGRTHQIRIHLWSMGIPVLGDPAYRKSGEIAETQTLGIEDPPMCLHASRLSFKHPSTSEPLTIETANPDWAICPIDD